LISGIASSVTKYNIMTEFDNYNPSPQELEKRIGEIMARQPEGAERIEALKTILSCIDLTSLEGSDTNVKIFSICENARTFADHGNDIPNAAAVCFFPTFIQTAKKLLKGTNIKVATVAAGFPSGQLPLHLKSAEVAYAVAEGADEIDIVISRGKILENKCQEVYEEILKLREVAKGAKLKVILETGELETVFKIRRACEIALRAGADFLKTSTGKVQPAATPEAVLIMLDSIKEYHEETGKRIGIKPAGGISEPDDALRYYTLVKETLGEKWLDPKYFRIGASRLAHKIVAEVKGEANG
ncbi:MAG: deoxyribose-phosphate aldolase, partial [Bacteroidales bacterium]